MYNVYSNKIEFCETFYSTIIPGIKDEACDKGCIVCFYPVNGHSTDGILPSFLRT